MAHFAEINSENFVIRVLVVPDNQEHRGEDFLANDLQLGGRWIQTSYNNNLRKNFAGINFYYDELEDCFIPPKPNCHLEVYLDRTTFRWKCDNAEHTQTL